MSTGTTGYTPKGPTRQGGWVFLHFRTLDEIVKRRHRALCGMNRKKGLTWICYLDYMSQEVS
jgi:hypothetical protein